MDYFDIAAENGGNLAAAFKNSDTLLPCLLPAIGCSRLLRASRWCARLMRPPMSALSKLAYRGHDAFLLMGRYAATLSGFLAGSRRGGWHDQIDPNRKPPAISMAIALICQVVPNASLNRNVGYWLR